MFIFNVIKVTDGLDSSPVSVFGFLSSWRMKIFLVYLTKIEASLPTRFRYPFFWCDLNIWVLMQIKEWIQAITHIEWVLDTTHYSSLWLWCNHNMQNVSTKFFFFFFFSLVFFSHWLQAVWDDAEMIREIGAKQKEKHNMQNVFFFFKNLNPREQAILESSRTSSAARTILKLLEMSEKRNWNNFFLLCASLACPRSSELYFTDKQQNGKFSEIPSSNISGFCSNQVDGAKHWMKIVEALSYSRPWDEEKYERMYS